MDSFWSDCLRHFENAIPAQQFKTWIQPLRVHLDGQTLHVAAPNRFVLEWVKDKYLGEIRRLSSEYLRTDIDISLSLAHDSAKSDQALRSEPPLATP
ncbi:MAG: DnaA N-terminal domain-containing protein, partial [Burkholderiales bacterium]